MHNPIQEAVHKLQLNLAAIGKQFSEETFISLAKQHSMNTDVVENTTYHKMLELRVVCHQQIDISKEIAEVLLQSGSSLCALLHGRLDEYTSIHKSYWHCRTLYATPVEWIANRKDFRLVL